MADRAISALPTASTLTASDLFVLSQSNQAKNTTWQVIIGYLTTALDGHGGIQSIAKTGTAGLVDTYSITYADSSTTTFTVTNGKQISSITQYWAVSSSNTTVPSSWSTTRQEMTTEDKYLWSYFRYTYNDGTTSDTTKSVVGVYGDTGQNWYVWIRYAGSRPTSDADIGTTPDNWIGIYSGTSATAPTSYTSYEWFEIKGEKGATGDAATITQQSVTYLESASGTVVPEGSWTTTVPSVTPGNYLWTRTILTFNDGTVNTAYSVSRYGIDGTGAVSTVNDISPDTQGNVALTATNIPTSDSTSVQSHIASIESDISDMQPVVADAKDQLLLYNTPLEFTTESGYVRHDTGVNGSSSGFARTNYVDVSGLKSVTYRQIGSASATPVAGMAFYDSNQTYISGVSAVASQGGTVYMPGLLTVAVPEGAVYARFSKVKDASDTATDHFELYGDTLAYDFSVSVLQAEVKTVSANGTTSNTLTGLTADHVVGNWGMFTDSACTAPIPENAPTCDITITTNEDEWVLVITNYSSTFYLRPTFILKQN